MSVMEVYYNTLLGVTQGCFEVCNGTLFWGVPLHPVGCTTASVAEAPKKEYCNTPFFTV